MKVCTDSCLFGAWVADKIEKKIIQPAKILDIGSGTGLLSLMMAQKFAGVIDAIEINENSFSQTMENFMQSPWGKRLKAFHEDTMVWNSSEKYDFIISNPPFFENNLLSPDQDRSQTKHSTTLTLEGLLESIKNLLKSHGNFALLLPLHRVQYVKTLAVVKEFYLQEELLIKQTPRHSYFRGILLFGTEPVSAIHDELIIKGNDGNYSVPFENLLKDYYLNF
ncbi:MAG: methyltransferase [Ginsengibacter sp.]